MHQRQHFRQVPLSYEIFFTTALKFLCCDYCFQILGVLAKLSNVSDASKALSFSLSFFVLTLSITRMISLQTLVVGKCANAAVQRD
jgi:hypothetical protein